MENKKEIYVVVKHSGMMYDNHQCVDRAFTKLETAEKYADELNDVNAKLFAKFTDTEDNAMYNIRTLMDAYIEKYYPELWKQISVEDTSSNDEELWEQVSNIEDELEKDRDELFEFAKEIGLSEQDINDMRTYYEYIDQENSDGALPFYTIAKNVELIED